MNSDVLVMRFRDLGGIDDAIKEHQKVIEGKGYTWAGWWAKTYEILPIGAVQELQKKAQEQTITLANNHIVFA